VFNAGIFLGSAVEAFRPPLTYVLSKRLFQDPRVAIMAAALSVIPDGIVGTFPAPWFYSLTLLLFLVLLLVLRAQIRGTGVSALVLVSAAGLVTAHPLITIFLLLAFVISGILSFVLAQGRPLKPRIGESSPRATFVVFLVILYLSWIALLTLVLQVSVARLVEAFRNAGLVDPVRYGRFFTPDLVVKTFGASLLLGLYALGAFVMLRSWVLDFDRPDVRLITSLMLSAVVLGVVFEVIASASLLADFVQRPLNVLVLFLPLYAGAFVVRFASRFKSAPRFVIQNAAVYIPFVIAIAAMFPSPYVALFNYQNTQQLYSSVDWAATNLPDNASVLSNAYVGRFAYYPFYTDEPGYSKLFHYENTLPKAIGEVTAATGPPCYIISDRESVLAATLDLRAWDFPTASDVKILEQLPGVARIYDNGDVAIYSLASC